MVSFRRREPVPRSGGFGEAKAIADARIIYFGLCVSMTLIGKKRADTAFLPRIRFYMTRLRYFPELWYKNRHIGTKQADNYMLRWGYLLDHDPSFDELIHGTTGAAAWYALENLE